MDYLLLIISTLILGALILSLAHNKKRENITQPIQDLLSLIKEGISDSRKEAREISTENRKENRENFKSLQDSVLDRIGENLKLQKEQLTNFSLSLNSFKDELNKTSKEANDSLNKKLENFTEKTASKHRSFEEVMQIQGKENRTELSRGLKEFQEHLSKALNSFKDSIRENFEEQNKLQLQSQKSSLEGIREVKNTVEKQLGEIRKDNEKQLGEMRNTVDEKLQSTLEKRLGESFKQVSERLEQVHKGLGEMQTIASGVGDLKKVLSNVKTRGVLGEYQLGNILEQILAPEQYAQNVATKKGSQAIVEYAVKLPGKNSDEEVWMPIDAKFPMQTYQVLLNAYDEGTPDAIQQAEKQLIKTIEFCAKTISDKYIDPPNTTDFAIMFLPIESLYGEVLRNPGLFELLQKKYKITVTGPTTLSAVLNSLQMGFRTLAVQKRSSEVWNVLSAVKTEFSKFSGQLEKVQKQLNQASGSLENLRSTRTNQMDKKLKTIELLDAAKAQNILELPDSDEQELPIAN
ncbi:DNA recombination protein RmuC [Maribellus sediminis]|uniref:DNA recombination protein RmuC n=1 Tax=Maribellus sediminis TaxID=2696285 RepID=UPI001430BFA7|nr:DNA recombination protein RmuC [Maribellus sediminis]